MKLFPACAAALVAAALISPALADEVTYFDKDGVRYQKIRQVTQRPISEMRYETRESTTHRERYTTDMQQVQRTYSVPITEQQWVPGYQRTWNVFAPPVLSYRLMPVTRRDLVPEKLTQQVPVWNTRYAEEELVRTVPVGPSGNASAVARSSGDTTSSGRSEADTASGDSTPEWKGGSDLRR